MANLQNYRANKHMYYEKQHSPFRKQKIRHENENQEDDQVKKSDRKRMLQTAELGPIGQEKGGRGQRYRYRLK